MTNVILDHPFTVFAALALTIVVSYAGSLLAMNSRVLLDDPNHRSSHTQATSRAGGIAMLIATVAGLVVIAVFVRDEPFREAALSFVFLGVLAGGVGLADDHLNLNATVKLAGQIIVACLFVWLVGGLDYAAAPFVGIVPMGFVGDVITVFWIVAFINAFNFMDGVNGIAGCAAALGLTAFGCIALQAGAALAAMIAFVTAAAAAGFLPANLVRGKLFMGDCGSHFLAFMIAGLAVFAANISEGRASEWLLPTILLPFILDVAFTLGHRMARGQNVLVAHREHIYQLVLQRGASHGAVAAYYAGAVAFCGAGAIFMLALPPQLMWVMPAILSAVLILIGIRIFSLAKADNLIVDAAASGDPGQGRRNEVAES